MVSRLLANFLGKFRFSQALMRRVGVTELFFSTAQNTKQINISKTVTTVCDFLVTLIYDILDIHHHRNKKVRNSTFFYEMLYAHMPLFASGVAFPILCFHR